MLSVTQNGDITKWITGEGNIKLSLDEVNEKELLLIKIIRRNFPSFEGN